MQQRVFIIHGWGGNPNEGWFPWLKKELEKKQFVVSVPAMPTTDHPIINKWVPFLKKNVGTANEQTYFVGHSIGCQTILRYVTRLPPTTKIGGIVLVAPWVHLINQTDEEMQIAQPWIETPIPWEKVKKHITHIVSIFSDNDDCVPLSDSAIFKKQLNTKIIIEHNKGHFSGSDDIMELPSALNALLTMIQ